MVSSSINHSKEFELFSQYLQSNGLRFPVLYLEALNQLKESTAWAQSKKLKLPQEDTKNLLMSLWAEGLLEVSK